MRDGSPHILELATYQRGEMRCLTSENVLDLETKMCSFEFLLCKNPLRIEVGMLTLGNSSRY